MATTNLVEEIMTKAAALPLDLQREALNFVEFLERKANNGQVTDGQATSNAPIENNKAERQSRPPVKSVIGCLEHLGVNITDEDIAEARREMWANFPRELPQ
jgi:hypothetical protein